MMTIKQRTLPILLAVCFASSAFAQSPLGPLATIPNVKLSASHLAPPRALGFGDNGESGTYTYDGAGNITAIGSDSFRYDAQGRLVHAVIRGVTVDYTYDAFGNRTSATGETNCLGQTVCATPLTVSAGTNHLLTTTNGGATTNVLYDAAGNITSASGGTYAYDGSGMMTEATVGSDDRQFVYTADDERIAVRQGQSWTWTVRGLDNKVLRELTSTEPNPSPGLPTPGGQWVRDYVWRDGLLLASTDSSGTYHYHLDHLGTPRLITNMSHVKVAEHAYYPFGAEISILPHESIEEAMKFTGHERDLVAGNGHTLDDMHARYYNATVGSFLSIDPEMQSAHVDLPQSWNRYAYVMNNTLKYVDPTGREITCVTVTDEKGNKSTICSDSVDVQGNEPKTQEVIPPPLSWANTQPIDLSALARRKQDHDHAKLDTIDSEMERIAKMQHCVEGTIVPLVVGGGEVVAGGAAMYAGGVLAGAGITSAGPSYGISLALVPVGGAVSAGGAYLLVGGVSTYSNTINNWFGTRLPSASRTFPRYFPAYPPPNSNPCGEH